MAKRFADENFPPEIQEQAERMNTDEAKVPAAELPPLPFDDHTTGTEFQTRVRPGIIYCKPGFARGVKNGLRKL